MAETSLPPQLSVVVPSVNGLGDLVGCLEALQKQSPEVRLEILVPERCGEEVRKSVADLFPDVTVIPVEPSATIPDMRAVAFRAARGDAVAVIEDHIIVPPDWPRQMLDALSDGVQVVGGSIENVATTRWIDWAAFLCEYSQCLPPLPEGELPWLTGNNVVYRRELLERFRSATGGGKWENHLHDAIRAADIALICKPAIRVGHKKHYTFLEYLTQRYYYARSYAGARVAGTPLTKRIAYGLAAFALPPLLFYRTVTRILSKRRHRKELLVGLAPIAVFVAAWGLGEIIGYWMGPGRALSKVC